MSRITSIQEQLQHVDELIAHLERVAVDNPRPSTFANIRSLEKERKTLHRDFERAAAQARFDVCRYRVVNKTPATIDGLTDVWRAFENLLTVVYQSIKGVLPPPATKKRRGRKKGTETTAAGAPPVLRLGFGYTFPGSVGLALTLPNQDALFADEMIIKAADMIVELGNAYGSADRVHHLVRQLGPVPTEAMYQWIAKHLAHEYGVGIEWQRDGETTSKMFLQYEELDVLRSELSRTTIEERIEVIGTLVTVDTIANRFVINADIGESYEGRFTDAITAEHAARVPSRYNANILATKKVIAIEGEEETTDYFLVGLSDLN